MAPESIVAPTSRPTVKVAVWDLDDTVWHGTLLEGGAQTLRPGVAEAIAELDRRGILQSIASRNDHASAMSRLESFAVAHFFVQPQIGWGAKSDAIARIAQRLNLATDTFAFIDDQAFEHEEVAFHHPKVLLVEATDVHTVLERPEFKPRFVTVDSVNRRRMYLEDAQRADVEQSFEGPVEEFLSTLDLEMAITPAGPGDLERAQELTLRTNQLNTTGRTYDFDELENFMRSEQHELLVASLTDRFGTYGRIGLCLVQFEPAHWTLKLLLMSCRVMSRGVGTVLLNDVVRRARDAGAVLRADFCRTDRNRAMFVTFRLCGFRIVSEADGAVVLEHDGRPAAPAPAYVRLRAT